MRNLAEKWEIWLRNKKFDWEFGWETKKFGFKWWFGWEAEKVRRAVDKLRENSWDCLELEAWQIGRKTEISNSHQELRKLPKKLRKMTQNFRKIIENWEIIWILQSSFGVDKRIEKRLANASWIHFEWRLFFSWILDGVISVLFSSSMGNKYYLSP